MRTLKTIVLFGCTWVIAAGCGPAGPRTVGIRVFDPARMSSIRALYNEPVNLAALSDDCVVSKYHLTATDANGNRFYDKVHEVTPDLSAFGSMSSQPAFESVADAMDFVTSFNVIDSTDAASLESVEISFKGVIKLCRDLWGGEGSIATVMGIYYGSRTVNLNNLPAESNTRCAGVDNCILVDSYATKLYPSRETADIQTFIASADKKRFVPLYLYHLNTGCKDDASAAADRNSLKVDAVLADLSDTFSATYSGHDDDKVHFLPEGSYDATYLKTVLVSALVGETYEFTFTQGAGTGCTKGLTKTKRITVNESDVFDANGNRIANSLDYTFDWSE